MIASLAEFLEDIVKTETKKLAEYSYIPHGPTIGSMYEGLTHKVVKHTLPNSLDLRIANGFIRSRQGDLSKQIDCMLVQGDGESIPNSLTNSYIYPIEKVIMAIEVKKSLSQTAFYDGFENFDSYSKFVPEIDLPFSTVQSAFQSITRKPLNGKADIEKYTDSEQMIYHSLVTEAASPVRVLIGYDGYKSEHTFRKGVTKFFLDSFASGNKISIPQIPSLILCGEFSIIKLNGLPYSAYSGDEWWPLLASYHTDSIKVLIELIWSRLSFMANLDNSVFGEDLDFETLKPFLRARHIDKNLWNLQLVDLPKRALSRSSATTEWHPAEITEQEFIFIQILKGNPDLKINDVDLQEFIAAEKININEFFLGLREKGLIYFDGTGFEYLTKELAVVVVPGLGWVAGDNADDRLMKWLMKQMNSTKTG